MSQQNVEIVKAAIDAWNREDWDAMLRDMAPGFELDLSRAVGPHHGVFDVDQVRGVLEEFTAGWESFRVEAHEFIDAGELVVEPQTARVKGRDGIEASATVTFVWTIRDRAIERVVMYQDRKDALEAVGLSEQDAHIDS
jgi:ketosteroid isomerase-like protein